MIDLPENANSFECPGCGKELDPRDRWRTSITESGYCSLMCPGLWDGELDG